MCRHGGGAPATVDWRRLSPQPIQARSLMGQANRPVDPGGRGARRIAAELAIGSLARGGRVQFRRVAIGHSLYCGVLRPSSWCQASLYPAAHRRSAGKGHAATGEILQPGAEPRLSPGERVRFAASEARSAAGAKRRGGVRMAEVIAPRCACTNLAPPGHRLRITDRRWNGRPGRVPMRVLAGGRVRGRKSLQGAGREHRLRTRPGRPLARTASTAFAAFMTFRSLKNLTEPSNPGATTKNGLPKEAISRFWVRGQDLNL